MASFTRPLESGNGGLQVLTLLKEGLLARQGQGSGELF